MSRPVGSLEKTITGGKMHFEEIMHFRRTSAGSVPLEILQALELPMPADVLEQFVFDHGANEEFQKQYSHLNLHTLQWDLISAETKDILTCSVYPHFIGWMETATSRTRVVPFDGWNDVLLPPGAAQYWRDHGTWMRPPIIITGDLVGSDSALHLAEGHTRVGA